MVDSIVEAKHTNPCPRFLVRTGSELTAENGLVEVYLAVPDLQVETTIRVSAYPRFVRDCRTLASEIRQRYQVAIAAFQAFGE